MSSMVAEMPRTKRNDVAVKIDAEIVRKARTMASYRGIPLAQYLSEKLRKDVDHEFILFRKEIAKDKNGTS